MRAWLSTSMSLGQQANPRCLDAMRDAAMSGGKSLLAADCLANLAARWRALGDDAEALHCLVDAAEAYFALGDLPHAAESTAVAAHTLISVGHLRPALQEALTARAVFDGLGSTDVAYVRSIEGMALSRMRRDAEAMEALERAVAELEEHGDHYEQATCQIEAGIVAMRNGDDEAASRMFAESRRNIGVSAGECAELVHCDELHYLALGRLGRVDEARPVLDEGRSIRARLPDNRLD